MDLPGKSGTLDLGCVPIQPSLRVALKQAKFNLISDFDRVTPVLLAEEAKISREDALMVLRLIKQTQEMSDSVSSALGRSALDILSEEKQRVPVITFCDAIDKMLGGGVPTGSVSEFCGVPGIGKTQMGMQLAVDVQLPAMFGGVGGQAIYIDTEGSFMPERVAEIAGSFVAHLQKMTRMRRNTEEMAVADALTVDVVLENIFFHRVYNYTEQVALVNVLPEFLAQNPRVKLIVIDSITFHFRHSDDFKDMGHRTRLLSSMSQTLASVAESQQCAVVLVNQVTTKLTDREAHLVPALGESWSHTCTSRVILFWEGGQRYAHLFKSPQLKSDTVPYRITTAGIRDIDKRKRERE
eukprot:TRINITY_DN1622_c0_g1_i1.p1 TRINITY_DN1622_c0_g1~~TRINITY_DN1622_c0_g1_i1.p1  ORF type:complete len:361 (+),score=75.33 TRINITY_DN1622_c0_g1_i1:25-1083(+)